MANISFDFNFWTLTLLLMNFALALFVAFTNRHKAAADELKSVKSSLQADIVKVSEQLVRLGEKVATVEADVENGITKDDLTGVHKRVDEILRTIGPLEGRLDEMSKSMGRIDQHLMQLLNQSR
jgi:prefoldin subunit 5